MTRNSHGAFKVGYKFHMHQVFIQPFLMGGFIVAMYSGVLWAPNRKALRKSLYQYSSREMCASQFNEKTNKPVDFPNGELNTMATTFWWKFTLY